MRPHRGGYLKRNPRYKNSTETGHLIPMKISYSGNDINVTLNQPTTVGDIISNPNYKAVLGFSDNVAVQVNGVAVDNGYVLNGSESVSLTVRANSKAA